MAQDTLEDDESVQREYDHGGRVVKIGSWHATYRYDQPDDEGGYHGHEYDTERRALAHGRLRETADYSTGDTTVPLAVVLEGKKAVAAFLYTECNVEPAYIARKMDLAEITVQQYISDFLKGR